VLTDIDYYSVIIEKKQLAKYAKKWVYSKITLKCFDFLLFLHVCDFYPLFMIFIV